MLNNFLDQLQQSFFDLVMSKSYRFYHDLLRNFKWSVQLCSTKFKARSKKAKEKRKMTMQILAIDIIEKFKFKPFTPIQFQPFVHKL